MAQSEKVKECFVKCINSCVLHSDWTLESYRSLYLYLFLLADDLCRVSGLSARRVESESSSNRSMGSNLTFHRRSALSGNSTHHLRSMKTSPVAGTAETFIAVMTLSFIFFQNRLSYHNESCKEMSSYLKGTLLSRHRTSKEE